MFRQTIITRRILGAGLALALMFLAFGVYAVVTNPGTQGAQPVSADTKISA